MKILAFVHDHYGHRIVDNMSAHAPVSWELRQLEASRSLPPIVDDPLEFLPAALAPVDLILSLAETPQAAQLLPGLVSLTGASLVIAPVDNEAWLPSGLRLQLQRELSTFDAEIHYPQPFCSLDEPSQLEVDRGSRPATILKQFTAYFGKPRLRILLEADHETISEVVVEREAPCGSSRYAAKRIAGMKLGEVVPRGGLICLHYPCLASMQPKTTDQGVETLMHTSGIIYNQALQRAIGAIEASAASPNLKIL
jgi:hypothetical protein